jgi:hypothetical protein
MIGKHLSPPQRLTVAVILVSIFLGVPCLATEPPVQIEAVQIGFGGVYKLGQWTPLRVHVRGVADGEQLQLELTTADGDGVPATFVQTGWAPAASGTSVIVQGYIKPGRAQGEIAVHLLADGQTLARRVFAGVDLPAPVTSTDELILTFGNPVGIEDAVRRARRDRSRGTTIQPVDDPLQLPDAWFGYEAVDWIVVTTSQASVLEQISDQQFAALDRWLRLGGRLVLSAGRRGEEIFAPDNRLARFAPGTSPAVVAQRITSGLESYAGANDRLDVVGGTRSKRFSVPMTALTGVGGLVESDEIGGVAGRLATIVRSAYGLGQIVFLAFDPDLPPFDQWQGRPTLMARVLQMTDPGRGRDADAEERSNQIAQLGYRDISGQLRSALDEYQGVTRVRFSWVAGLIAVYILLIGPGDYLLLKKLQRTQWTWLTFPALSAAFCVVAYFLVTHMSGDQLHVNRVDVVDVDVAGAAVRGTCWTHIYSPVAQELDLSQNIGLPWPDADDRPRVSLLSWQGLPGRGLGGLDTRSASAPFSDPYQILLPDHVVADSRDKVRGMPIEVSGSRSLLGQWWSEVPVRSDLSLTVDSNGLLSGSVANPLSIELTDCRVLYENWIYPISAGLKPGQSISLDGVRPKNLEYHLTRRRDVDGRDVRSNWDPTGTDVARLLEMMMFFGSIEGESYTKLTHRYQHQIDLSDHLRSGRAILVGRAAVPATELYRDGRSLAAHTDRHWTFYRLVFPVDNPERR